jgi:hypothetical protein
MPVNQNTVEQGIYIHRFSWALSESSAVLGFERKLLSLWNGNEESTSISGLLGY